MEHWKYATVRLPSNRKFAPQLVGQGKSPKTNGGTKDMKKIETRTKPSKLKNANDNQHVKNAKMMIRSVRKEGKIPEIKAKLDVRKPSTLPQRRVGRERSSEKFRTRCTPELTAL